MQIQLYSHTNTVTIEHCNILANFLCTAVINESLLVEPVN